ncbi:unnamed protein product [Cochlearia groenlandica]
MSIIAKFALDYGLTPRVLVAERLVIASTILIPLALIFERPMLEQNLYYAGMQLTTPTFTSGMFNLLPAITFIMACLFKLEKVDIRSLRGKAKVLGTCVAVLGAMMMTFWRGQVIPLPWTCAVKSEKTHTNDKENIVKGGLMLVCSCLSWSFYVILQTKVVLSYPAKLSLTALICSIGAVLSSVTALIWERNNTRAWRIYPDVTLLASLYGGCFSAITVYVVGWLAKKRGPVFVSIFIPINLIVTAIISSFILLENMFVGRIIGAFVIIFGISSVLWGKMGDQTFPQPPPTPTPDGEEIKQETYDVKV